MLYKIGEVVSVVEVMLNDELTCYPSQNLTPFISSFKKISKANPEQIQFNLAKLTVVECQEFGFEGEVIDGTEVSTGQYASCTKKGYWMIGEKEYFDYEFFKSTFRSALPINTVVYLNAILRRYRKPAVSDE